MNTEQFDGHTPGPWVWDSTILTNHEAIHWAYGTKGVDIVDIRVGPMAQEPDLQLMAAAPDLLAEVKRLQHQVEAARGVLRLLYHDELEDAEWIRWFCDIEEE